MARQMYAITCCTDIARKRKFCFFFCISFAIQATQMNMNFYFFYVIIEKHIMNEIRWLFPVELLQYACVSMDSSESMATFRTIYIQIILKRVINKTGWFLDEITGMCI
jgi:hypothetical protein